MSLGNGIGVDTPENGQSVIGDLSICWDPSKPHVLTGRRQRERSGVGPPVLLGFHVRRTYYIGSIQLWNARTDKSRRDANDLNVDECLVSGKQGETHRSGKERGEKERCCK